MELRFVGKNTMPAPIELHIRLDLPEGWSADRNELSMYLHEMRWRLKEETTVKITAGENVKAVNRIYATISSPGRIMTGVLPIIISGS